MQDDLDKAVAQLTLKEKGPFITQPDFWASEGGGENPASGAPLLDRNNGLLESNGDNQSVLARAAK